MSDDERPAVAAYRRYVLQLLDRDMAYDDDPTDDPPLLIADYRRALLGVRPPDDDTRLLVVDGDGEVVASFDRSEFDTAHRWAHDRAAEPLTNRPVQIEDLGRRESWRIDRTSCRHRRWMPASPPLASARCPRADPTATVRSVDTDDV